jgi:hypothetical protein
MIFAMHVAAELLSWSGVQVKQRFAGDVMIFAMQVAAEVHCQVKQRFCW